MTTPQQPAVERDSVLILAFARYPEVRIRKQVALLVEAGFEVDLVSLAPLDGAPLPAGLTVHALPCPKSRSRAVSYLIEYLWFSVLACFAAAWLSLRRPPAVVQVFNQPDFLIAATLVPRLFGARVVFDYRDDTPDAVIDIVGLAPGSVAVRLLRAVELLAFRLSDHVLTVHSAFQQRVVDWGIPRDRTSVYMNLPDPQLFDRRRCEATNGAAGSLRLVHHGTLADVYNVGLVLDALALIRERRPDVAVSLAVVGSGPLLPALQEQAERQQLDNVAFTGLLPLEAIPAFLCSQCDAGVVPTRQGALGDYSLSNKLLEYAAMGKPVLVSRLPVVQALLRPESAGWFDSSDPGELADAILALADDLSLRAERVANADHDLAPWSTAANNAAYRDRIVRLARRGE